MSASRPRPNILYLTHRVPYPLDKGDRIRSFNILKYISQRASLHLASLSDEDVAPTTVTALESYCARLAIIPIGLGRWPNAARSFLFGRTVTEGAFRSRAMQAQLTDWARETRFDAMIMSSSGMMSYRQRERELRGVPAVMDLVDVDSQKWFDYSASSLGPKAWLYRTEGRRLREFEREIARQVRAVTVISEAEAEIFRAFGPSDAVRVVHQGCEVSQVIAPPADSETCTFVGALDYLPNVDGIGWFAREVWPAIHRRRPTARLEVVGRKPVAAVQALASLPGVTVVGPVPDVRPYLDRSAVVVVPLRIARGVQNKVLEAMAAGRAVVSSPQALTGLKAEPGVHVLTAASPDEWEHLLLRVLDDSGLRAGLGSAARRYVEEHHSWESCLKPLDELLGLAPEPDLPT